MTSSGSRQKATSVLSIKRAQRQNSSAGIPRKVQCDRDRLGRSNDQSGHLVESPLFLVLMACSQVWDPWVKDMDKACVQSINDHDGTVLSILPFDEGRMMITSGTDMQVKIWAPLEGRDMMMYPRFVQAPPIFPSLFFSPVQPVLGGTGGGDERPCHFHGVDPQPSLLWA